MPFYQKMLQGTGLPNHKVADTTTRHVAGRQPSRKTLEGFSGQSPVFSEPQPLIAAVVAEQSGSASTPQPLNKFIRDL